MTACSGLGACFDPVAVPLTAVVVLWCAALPAGGALGGLRGGASIAHVVAGSVLLLVVAASAWLASVLLDETWWLALIAAPLLVAAAAIHTPGSFVVGLRDGAGAALLAGGMWMVYVVASGLAFSWVATPVGRVALAVVLAALALSPSLAWGLRLRRGGLRHGVAMAWCSFGIVLLAFVWT